jgi:type IV secretory pathway TrbF-like protein
MKFRKSEEKEKQPVLEKTRYSRYYEHDGILRAYANRAMLLAFLCVPVALISVGLAAYVRLQPPTVIRVDQNGEAVVVGQKSNKLFVAQGASADPADFEREAVVKGFLDHYLNFSPDSVNRNWAEALNLMTLNLRRSTLDAMEKDNSAGKVQDDQITSVFHLRSIEASKDDPLTYTAFGVKEVHHVHDHRETTDKLVGEYRIRLIPEKRSEDNPSGLLIAEYGEKFITGERADAVAQETALDASNQNKN